MQQKPTESLTVLLRPTTLKKLKALAESQDRLVSSMARLLIQNALNRGEE